MQKIKFDGDDFKKEKKIIASNSHIFIKRVKKILKKKKEYMSNIYIKI